ncbi:MAG: hypothetical protein JO316_06585 [Abitibacteriaceae bacterium]|nr:hypothetical protein [Abditibacteriaceae bacterium]
MNILFVCSGNTCRSPLAVAAWQAFAVPSLQASARTADAEVPQLPAISVSSAGLTAYDGAPASHYTCAIARDWGVDLSQHLSRRLTAEMVAEAQLVCTMTTDQAATVRLRFAVDPQDVLLLGDFAPETEDLLRRLTDSMELAPMDEATPDEARREHHSILDPYGGSVEAYQTCAAQIRAAVLGLVQSLCEGTIPNLKEDKGA